MEVILSLIGFLFLGVMVLYVSTSSIVLGE